MKLLPALVSVFAAAVCLHAAAAAPAANRSLFVWNTQAIRSDDAVRTQFFDFLAAPFGAPDRRIETLFFDGVSSAQLAEPAAAAGARAFLGAAHARGIRVIYLCGDPSWARPSKEAQGLDYLSSVLNFNAAGQPDQRYDGIAYDVEPYLSPEWPAQALQDGYVDLYEKSMQAIRSSGRTLPLVAIIPRWFSNPNLNGLDRKIIDRSDAIVIMDYVDTAERLVSGAAAELEDAASAKKLVWVAVETGQLKDEPRATFFGRTNSQMEDILAQALPDLARQPSFAGIAIHSLRSYQPMTP